MKMFPDYAEKDSCTNILKTNFHKYYFLAVRKQVMVSMEERLEQTEEHTIFSSLCNISASAILEEKILHGSRLSRYFLKILWKLIKMI